MIDGIEVKFVGVVQTINEAKKFGMVACDEASAMWNQEVYAFQDVLRSCDAGVGDTIRFGIHISGRGQPQVSLPVFKIGPDGQAMNVPSGTNFVNVEDLIAEDPGMTDRIKEEIERSSGRQNAKKSRMSPYGGGGGGGGYGGKDGKGKGGKDKGKGKGDYGKGGGAYYDDPWGGGGGGGGGGNYGDVTLFVSGVPPGIERRELLHIFRQYAGFSNLRVVDREDHTLVFVSFATQAQAQFVADALTGYVFDEEAPPHERSTLSLAPSKPKSKGDSKGKY